MAQAAVARTEYAIDVRTRRRALDTEEVRRMVAEIKKALSGGAGVIAIDLSYVEEIHSSIITLLVGCDRLCRERGVELRLRNASETVRKTVATLGADFLKIE